MKEKKEKKEKKIAKAKSPKTKVSAAKKEEKKVVKTAKKKEKPVKKVKEEKTKKEEKKTVKPVKNSNKEVKNEPKKEEKKTVKVVKAEVKKEEKKVVKTAKKKEIPLKIVKEEALEEKVKKETVKKTKDVTKTVYECELNKKDQKTYRVLSRIISIVAKILKVASMIIVPFILLIMIIFPIFFNNIEIDGNIVKYHNAKFVFGNDAITVNVGDNRYVISDNIENIENVVQFLNNNSASKIVTSVLLSLGFAAIIMTINIYLLQCAEKLFDNFYRKKTPFETINCKYIRQIGQIMIVSTVLTMVFGMIVGLVCDKTFAFKGTGYGILQILVVYIAYYIFKYAVNMQNKIDTKMVE